jgi:hypothetical protein
MTHSLVFIQFIADLTTLAAAATSLAGTVLSYWEKRAGTHGIRHAQNEDKDGTEPSAAPGRSHLS